MRYETKIIRVCFSNWRLIFSLTINLLVLVLQPSETSAETSGWTAQASTNEQDNKQVVQNNQASEALEPKILSEINRVRTNPQDYAQWLEEQRQYYDGIWLRLPGEKPIRTNKGRKALEEAIAFLKAQQPLPPLEISDRAANAATSELENFATANNIQYFSYGRKTAVGIVMGLVVDELFPDRRRRNSLLSPDAEDTGVVCKPDPRYAKVCAIAYSDSPTVATAKPEPTANSDDQTDLPETTATSEAPISPEATKPETVEAVPESTQSTDENTDLATLPVPPAPQAPPAPTENSTEPKPEIEADTTEPKPEELAQTDRENELKLEENQSEIEEEQIIEEEESEPEAEAIEDEPEATVDSEVETEAEAIEDEPVATNSQSDRLLEKVERGSLEKGDRIIADDGSLYDFYPLEGKAGESFTIYLESDDFDAFVALVDSKGNTIKENDDISEEDSNSRIQVTLPEDGSYNIIVNTYDEEGTGEYILTLSR